MFDHDVLPGFPNGFEESTIRSVLGSRPRDSGLTYEHLDSAHELLLGCRCHGRVVLRGRRRLAARHRAGHQRADQSGSTLDSAKPGRRPSGGTGLTSTAYGAMT